MKNCFKKIAAPALAIAISGVMATVGNAAPPPSMIGWLQGDQSVNPQHLEAPVCTTSSTTVMRLAPGTYKVTGDPRRQDDPVANPSMAAPCAKGAVISTIGNSPLAVRLAVALPSLYVGEPDFGPVGPINTAVLVRHNGLFGDEAALVSVASMGDKVRLSLRGDCQDIGPTPSWVSVECRDGLMQVTVLH